MENVLFLSNHVYLDTNRREGGVRNCTFEFIDLLKDKFNVITFPVSLKKSFAFRVRVKLGFNQYNDFNANEYQHQLQEIIISKNITYVFLNMSNTITFAPVLKKIFGEKVKVILCSHGNESGDFLHEAVRFSDKANFIKKIFSTYALGKLIIKESVSRNNFVDMTLSISEVENNIEKWLGSPSTFMVPRIIKPQPINWNPKLNTVGFIGDISHLPNQYGVISICESLQKIPGHGIQFRLVGGPEHIGKSIADRFSFVHYCGFLSEEDLLKEVSGWGCFLNLVFYYSRGVSTKLAKALSWGLPVISTTSGNRGYPYIGNKLPIADTPDDMAKLIIQSVSNIDSINLIRDASLDIVNQSPSFAHIMKDLYPQILKL